MRSELHVGGDAWTIQEVAEEMFPSKWCFWWWKHIENIGKYGKLSIKDGGWGQIESYPCFMWIHMIELSLFVNLSTDITTQVKYFLHVSPFFWISNICSILECDYQWSTSISFLKYCQRIVYPHRHIYCLMSKFKM